MNNAELSSNFVQILGLNRKPVGVKFIDNASNFCLDGYDFTLKIRFCQSLMLATQGNKVVITKDNITCPASGAALGFKPLPDALSSGKMLYDLGLFSSVDAGKKLMENITRLPLGKYEKIAVGPLDLMEFEPDVVIVESKPEHIMWIALASIFNTGKRCEFDTGIFQASCVDSTILPFVKNKLNVSLGCYGCRDATNISDDECLAGMPFKMANEVVESLKHLGKKPLPRARSKIALQSLQQSFKK